MDWKTFSIELLKAIAWPIAAIIILLILRKPLSSIILLLRKIKYNLLEFEFNKEAAEIKKSIEQSDLPATSSDALVTISDRFMELAVISPRTAILEKWDELKSSIFHAAERHKAVIEGYKNMTASQLVNALFDAGKISKDIREAFYSLKKWRDNVVYFDYSPLEPGTAITFADLARDLQRVFDIA